MSLINFNNQKINPQETCKISEALQNKNGTYYFNVFLSGAVIKSEIYDTESEANTAISLLETSINNSAIEIQDEVNTFADLPSASDNSGKIYIVLNSTGILWSKRKGIYRSDGSSWIRLSNLTLKVQDNEATFYDNNDNTKIMKFELSGISTSTTRTLTIQDKDYTIADAANVALNTTHRSSNGSDHSHVNTLLAGIGLPTNTLHVAKNGNDSTGNGSIEKPYLTVQHAINTSSPDSDNRYSIIIYPGVYTEQVTLKAFCYLKGTMPNSVYIEYNGDAVIAPSSMGYYESVLFNINIETLSTNNTYTALRIQTHGSVYAFNINVVSQVTGIIIEGDGFLYTDLGGVLTNEDGVDVQDTGFYVAKNFDFTAGGNPYNDLKSAAGAIVLLNNGNYYANARTNLLGTTLYISNSNFSENKSSVTGTTITDALNTIDGILNGGVSGSFTTVDSKTVTVTNGIITNIV